jgi:hypothetical protein
VSALKAAVNVRLARFAMWTSRRIVAPFGLSTKSGQAHVDASMLPLDVVVNWPQAVAK